MATSFFNRLLQRLFPKEPTSPPASTAVAPPPSGAGAERQMGNTAPASAPKTPPSTEGPSSLEKPVPVQRTPLPFQRDDNQRYYGWKALETDDIGLTYSYQTRFRLPQNVDDPEDKRSSPNLMVKGWYHEGKDRLGHIQRIERKYGTPLILISQSVKDLLAHFDLPLHCFHPVLLQPFRIDKIATPYYLLQLEYDTLRKQLAYPIPVMGLRKTATGQDGFRKPTTAMALPPLQDYKGIKELQAAISEDPTNDWRAPEIVTEHFSLATSFDLYTHKDEIVISEPLRDALQRHFPVSVSFYELNLPHIQIDPDLYHQKAEQYAALQEAVTPVSYSFSPEIQRLYERAEARLAGDFSIPLTAFGDDEFTELSRRLQLVLPDLFKATYRKKPDLNGWEWEHFRHIFTLEDADWKEAEAIGAIAFAGNGCGDHLGLPLEGDSLFTTGTLVYYFDHETGGCHELGDLADIESWKTNI